jgi:hypothetical protein
MARAGEFAYRQAYLLCPYSPEAVYRYVGFLVAEGRYDDAKAIVNASLKVVPDSKEFRDLKKSLNEAVK